MDMQGVNRSGRRSGFTRRAAVAGAGVTLLGVGSRYTEAAAQNAPSLAEHPMAGAWFVQANPMLPDDPQIPNLALFSGDGTVLLFFPLTQRGPQGVVFTTPYVGVWEPDDTRRAHFTATQILSDADGTMLGTVTVDGFPEASEDGQTFAEDGALVTVTVRDATGAIVNQMLPTGQPAGRPVTGVRTGVGASGFPDGEATAATPES